MFVIVKVVLSGLVIGIVTLIAGRNPTLGGWFAALPLITLLSVIWLTLDGESNESLARFMTGVLWGLIPTAALLAVAAYFVRRGVPSLLALGLGAIAWIAISLIAQRFGLIRW